MLKRVLGFSLLRFVALGLPLVALAGCNRTETSLYGYIEVIPSGVRAACEAPMTGQLQLDGILVADVVTISADELCHNWVVRREVPAGLYTVSWQPSDGVDRDTRWEVRDADLVNVFPEQTSTLRVSKVEPAPELLSQVAPEAPVHHW